MNAKNTAPPVRASLRGHGDTVSGTFRYYGTDGEPFAEPLLMRAVQSEENSRRVALAYADSGNAYKSISVGTRFWAAPVTDDDDDDSADADADGDTEDSDDDLTADDAHLLGEAITPDVAAGVRPEREGLTQADVDDLASAVDSRATPARPDPGSDVDGRALPILPVDRAKAEDVYTYAERAAPSRPARLFYAAKLRAVRAGDAPPHRDVT